MTVPVDNGHLRYREAGAGPPVVLLHGGGLDHRSWDDQVGPLSADHRVITPDARGHGGSSTRRRRTGTATTWPRCCGRWTPVR